MKPHFHRISGYLQNSFIIRHQKEPYFRAGWHYHPELELHYVVKGKGLRFIGDNVSNFEEGELILLGQNLPHSWRSKEEDFENTDQIGTEAIVIQFLPECLGTDFMNLPEAHLIKHLYEKARKGIIISGTAKMKLVSLMEKALVVEGLDKLVILLSILSALAEADDVETIASFNAFYQSHEAETARLNRIYSFTMANYKRELSLEEVAEIANLSITSFCRYFRLMTKKTYNDFLVEIRISHACRLLVEDTLVTEMVCFECGFRNVSNFYRHFKRVKGYTPLEYKRLFLVKKII
ncbi:AraC family transcriptional regulator [Pedobacter changchengzhani]|uniref:AraC family transcriptional regulator n=1 Tax=Pedobacter changchengzhani TaxID=2529274 RepID=A0A4R5MII4_9SPHI|nr:AraC family transcriptional regulator [Pedobacter changchengzhani]TDG35351.1 AraC family transcriptional regulator [Pedobacter changchengzhani]